jgi:hypothetical protein
MAPFNQSLLVLTFASFAIIGCGGTVGAHFNETAQMDDDAFLDMVQQNTFRWFWDWTPHDTGLVPDRAPSLSFSSIAAIGYGLTAYPIGVERGWVARDSARERTLNTLQYLWEQPQGDARSGTAGHRGHFYHFLTMDEGTRFATNELSSIDTGLLMMGALFAAEYWSGEHAEEQSIRAYADSLFRRVEWDWMVVREPLMSMGWFPEPGNYSADPETGFIMYDYEGYNEAMFLYILGLGSPTHPIPGDAWDAYTSTYRWGEYYGFDHLNFSPLFGHQYSHVWIDFRDIQDTYMRERGIDYFENSRRATLAQRAYAQDNPNDWRGYGGNIWGWTACDGPVDTTMVIDGRARTFRTYWARGVSANYENDDGTIAPTAAGGSVPFAPSETIAALRAMHALYGEHLFTEYGFLDAFNLTLREPIETQHGAVVEGLGWFNDDYLGIDQGPILIMIENHRTGMIWEYMRRNEHIRRGLEKAGFTGGWLDR